MATTTDEITLDIDALDAAAAGKGAEKPNGAAKAADSDAAVVVDADLAAKGGENAVLKPEDGIKALQKQLEDERNARTAAEARAREAANGEAAARGEVQKTQLDLIKGAIEQTTQQLDVLEVQYADAMTAQDFKAAAKAQREMSTKAADLAQLKAGENHLKNAPKPAPRAPVDPVEAYVARIGADFPRSRAWVRAHPDWARNENGQEQLVAAHQLAVRRGFAPESDQYFKDIEQTLRIEAAPHTQGAQSRQAHLDDVDPLADVAATAAVGGRSTSPAAAPVSRSGGANGSKPNVVKLSQDEVEMARNMFPDSKDPLQEYARNKIALKREGKLS